MSTPTKKDLTLPGVLKSTRESFALKKDLTPDEAWAELSRYLKNVDIRSTKTETGSWWWFERLLEVEDAEGWLRELERRRFYQNEYRDGRVVRWGGTTKYLR